MSVLSTEILDNFLVKIFFSFCSTESSLRHQDYVSNGFFVVWDGYICLMDILILYNLFMNVISQTISSSHNQHPVEEVLL